MADWNGSALRRWLCSADRLSEAAIFLASSDSKTWFSRSIASLCSVTSADHFFFAVMAGLLCRVACRETPHLGIGSPLVLSGATDLPAVALLRVANVPIVA